jgi:hypothetical protein
MHHGDLRDRRRVAENDIFGMDVRPGIQRRQPRSPGWRSQTTPRSPRIANGRFSSAETFWLIVGFRRFQSKVASTMKNRTIATSIVPEIMATFYGFWSSPLRSFCVSSVLNIVEKHIFL